MIWNRLSEAVNQVSLAGDEDLRTSIVDAFAFLCGANAHFIDVAPSRGIAFELTDGQTLFGHIVCDLIVEPAGLRPAGEILARFAATRLESARVRREAGQLRIIIDAADVALTVADNRRRTIYGNAGLVRNSGYTVEELNDIPPEKRIHEDDFAVVERAREANLRGEPTRIRWRMLAKGGRVVWVESFARPIPGPDGQIERIVLTSKLVTDEVQAQANLREKERKLAEARHFGECVAELASDVIYIVECASGKTLYANANLQRLLGYSAEQVIGKNSANLKELVHPDDRDKVLGANAKTLSQLDEGHCPLDCRIRHAEGHYLAFVGLETAFAHADDGAVTQVLGVVRASEANSHSATLVRKAIQAGA